MNNIQYYFVDSIYRVSSMTAMEKALIKLAEAWQDDVIPASDVKDMVSILRSEQEKILEQRPRLRPVDISFVACGRKVHFISVGSGSVTLRAVKRMPESF